MIICLHFRIGCTVNKSFVKSVSKQSFDQLRTINASDREAAIKKAIIKKIISPKDTNLPKQKPGLTQKLDQISIPVSNLFEADPKIRARS